MKKAVSQSKSQSQPGIASAAADKTADEKERKRKLQEEKERCNEEEKRKEEEQRAARRKIISHLIDILSHEGKEGQEDEYDWEFDIEQMARNLREEGFQKIRVACALELMASAGRSAMSADLY